MVVDGLDVDCEIVFAGEEGVAGGVRAWVAGVGVAVEGFDVGF